MKNISLLTFLISFLSLNAADLSAATPKKSLKCSAVYAVGLGHLMKGEALPFAEERPVIKDQPLVDDYFELSVVQSGENESLKLIRADTQQEVVLSRLDPKLDTIFVSIVPKDLKNYHALKTSVPGALYNQLFLFVLCE